MKAKSKKSKTIQLKLSDEAMSIVNQKPKSESGAIWFVEIPPDGEDGTKAI
jgi:hypothetical protein